MTFKTIGMKKIVKQVVGVDVAQDELVVCLGRMYEDWTPELYAFGKFDNNVKGFERFAAWVEKLMEGSVPVRYVMEATGVYHESLAYYLIEQGLGVSIVLPNKISNYARSLDIKTVTDKTASEAIARFGLERNLNQWKSPDPLYMRLRQLSRERGQLVDERTGLKNQLHAEQAGARPYKKSIERIKRRIALLDKQEKEILEEIKDFVKTNEEVKRLIILVCSLPGIGLLTAVTVVAETNGFDLIRNTRQLTSYAGLDKQSGTSVKGKPRISKKGNKHLRAAMHMPALAAIRHDGRFKAIFARLVSKHGIKMKAVVAVQRKLLEMTYTIFKTNRPYDKNYLQIKNHQKTLQTGT
jgi:transposase